MEQMTFCLPGGYMDEAGAVQRQVELMPLNGRAEEFLAAHSGWENARLFTGLLSRCIGRLGALSPVSEEIVRGLLVADRLYLLLKLRQLTLGDQVQATIVCPAPECAEKIDVDFSIADIPIQESDDKGPVYQLELSPAAAFSDGDGQQHRHVTFRLPTGADQEALAPWLTSAGDEAGAAALLLERCVQSIGPVKQPGGEVIARFSPQARQEIEQRMEAVAPQVALTINGDCPECGGEFEVPFDLQSFFLGDLRTNSDLLYREVHYLAYHYHWSEREIMSMPRTKRRKYIAVLAEEIERLNEAI